MMVIYKIPEENFCMLLFIYYKVTIVTNNCAVHTLCLRPTRKLILTANVLKFSLMNLYTIYIQKI